MALRVGIEPTTIRLTGVRSKPLSYRRSNSKSSRSNRWTSFPIRTSYRIRFDRCTYDDRVSFHTFRFTSINNPRCPARPKAYITGLLLIITGIYPHGKYSSGGYPLVVPCATKGRGYLYSHHSKWRDDWDSNPHYGFCRPAPAPAEHRLIRLDLLPLGR